MNGKKVLGIAVILTGLFSSTRVSACPFCHTSTGTAVRMGLLHHQFLLVVSTLIAIFLIFILIAMIISYSLARKINEKCLLQFHAANRPIVSVKAISYFLMAGMLLGGSAAGFIDGILFHQILQWHSMLVHKVPLDSLVNVEINMFWDGIFHGFTVLIILTSFGLLWRSLKQPQIYHATPILIGSIFTGAGLFNLIEGLVNHHFLQLHHVIEFSTASAKLYADVIFLVIAMIAMGFGSFAMRKGILKVC